MKEIIVNSPTYGLKSILVDDEDYDKLKHIRWYVVKKNDLYYVRRNISRLAKEETNEVYIHRYILSITDNKIKIDHKDHNPLNNQRCNLRTCTHQQNIANKRKNKNTSSKYLGVSKVKMSSRQGIKYEYWGAGIKPKMGKKIHLGLFPLTNEGEILAAKAYDNAAIKHYGEFANLNLNNGNQYDKL